MQLRPYQEEAVQAVHEAFQSVNSTLTVLPTGCHDPLQGLLTYEDGIVSAEALKVGDTLMGPDGSPRRILVRHEGIGPMVRIRPIKGMPFVVTLDHRLSLVRTNDGRTSQRDVIVDVSVATYLTWSKTKKHLHKLYRSPGVTFPNAKPLPLDPYVLGLLLGDGSFCAQLSFTKPEVELANAVATEIKRFGMVLVDSGSERCGKARCWHFRPEVANGHAAARFRRDVLDPLGLNHADSETKQIPWIYCTASVPDRLQLLAGLMDSDGHLSNNDYDFISKSLELSWGVVFVARSVGLAAYVTPSKKYSQNGNGGTYWRVSISGDCNRIPCRVPRKKASPRQQKKNVLRTGFSVENAGEGSYIGFTVDGDNRYLLDDFTVTHNCGKTICFCTIAQEFARRGRVMILAHREELIFQAAHKYERITGLRPGIEMADLKSEEGYAFGGTQQVIVSSVQTQIAGRNGGRMKKFDPHEFSLLVIDEAHHSPATSYKRILAHYRQNHDLKVLGVTATPDRADEEALGQVFESVAYDYEIMDAINDGWLVPIEQRCVHVEDLDLSAVKTTAGDLNGADLAQVMEYESNLHGVASPTMEIANGRKTLVFAASVAHAERLCEIFLRHEAGCARWVCGETPKIERRQLFADYAARKFQFLCNVGVATEGFDDPSIEVIAVARPTKSRSLYAQMCGRGLRPLPGVVDGLDTADERRLSIVSSAKPSLEVLDFEGNSGRHKLMSTADILGGKYSEAAVERARKAAEEATGAVDIADELERAEKEIATEKERELRKALRMRANYSTTLVDPFDIMHITPWRERGWDKGKPPSEKMKECLWKNGIDASHLSWTRCRQLIQEIIARRDRKQATFKQARVLAKHGYPTDVSFDQARQIIDALAANGWKRPVEGAVA